MSPSSNQSTHKNTGIDTNTESPSYRAVIKSLADTKTWLFVPATRIDRVEKAFASGGDAVIVDLEDAVEQADKAQARAALKAYYAAEHEAQGYRQTWLRIVQACSDVYAIDYVICSSVTTLTIGQF